MTVPTGETILCEQYGMNVPNDICDSLITVYCRARRFGKRCGISSKHAQVVTHLRLIRVKGEISHEEALSPSLSDSNSVEIV